MTKINIMVETDLKQTKLNFKVKKSLRNRSKATDELDPAQTVQEKTPRKTIQNLERTPSKRKSLFDEGNQNSPPKQKSPNAKSLLVCSPTRVKSPRVKSLPFTDITKSAVERAKQSLNTQQPETLLCREKELTVIQDFFAKHLVGRTAGSMYISGAPGTGKTAVIKHAMSLLQGDHVQCFINSMTMNALAVYRAIAQEVIGCGKTYRSSRQARAALEKSITQKGKMVLLVLDEMDQLDSKHQEILYSIFEWPSLRNSRLVLIGIANALDLTDRILPRLNRKALSRPELLQFTPYSKEQIIAVVNSRLQESKADEILDKSAVMFCARKVSAVAGDMRKALDICRRAIEVTELNARKQSILYPKGVVRQEKKTTADSPPKVSISQVAGVVDQIYGDNRSQPSTFPLQQKLVICSLLLLLKNSKLKEMSLGKLHDTYSKVCQKREVTATDQSEFISLCALLEARGLLQFSKSKQARHRKISLKLDTEALEFALHDKTLFTSILQCKL